MIKNIREVGGKMLLPLCMAFAVAPAQAAVVEHIGDRYIVNVSEMNLNGEETLLDVLLMCPEVITLDGKNVIGDDQFASLYGRFVLRIDNIEYGIDYKTFLSTIRAREIEKIKICQNPAVVKGCGGLKQVIDITLRKGENGTSGRVALSGDTYGGGSAFVSAMHQEDNFRLMGMVEGNMLRSKDDAGVTNHGSHEGAKVNLLWDITSKDNLELDFAQYYNRNRTTGSPADYSRCTRLEFVYTRTLSDAGAYGLVQGAGEYDSDNTIGQHNRYTYPYFLVEFAFPIINHNLWLTAGIETGYSAETDVIADMTNRSRYEDGYLQLDWNIGKWGFMIGDRFRTFNYWVNSLKTDNEYEHTTSNHAYTASVYHRFNGSSTLQGTFARRYYDPSFDDFIAEVGSNDSRYANAVDGKIYTPDYEKHIAYISELKYTYSKPDFVLGGLVKNIRQDLVVGHDNTLGVGATAFWHKGVFRVNAGFNYFWQKTTYSADDKAYNNFVTLKLAPQVSLSNGWRLASTMLYNSRKAYDSEFYTPANFYADVLVAKSFAKKWLVEARYHDIAGQHTGNRAATIGVTYYWGK